MLSSTPVGCQKIHLFIPDISIAPLQVHYYTEALQTTALICVAVNTLKRNRQLRAKDLPKVHTRRLGVGFERATFGTQDTETTPEPPRLTLMSLRL